MLRLAHRILAEPLWGYDNDTHAADTIKRGVAQSFIVVADNVADWFYSVRAEELARTGAVRNLDKDLPNARLPFPQMFVEWSSPPAAGSDLQCYGNYLADLAPHQRSSLLPMLPEEMRNAEQIVLSYPVWRVRNRVEVPGIVHFFSMGADGAIDRVYALDPHRDDIGNADPHSQIMEAMVSLMAVSFMHCKNVVRHDATSEVGPRDKWIRRMKAPRLTYHTLQIGPMREVLRTEGGIETNGLKKALHICRGHFAHYSEEKPLFGKYTGQFWKPAHVRGDLKQGAVVKDYNVKV